MCCYVYACMYIIIWGAPGALFNLSAQTCAHMYMYAVLFHIYFHIYVGPSALTVNILKNIRSSSIIILWNPVDDFLPTTYTVALTDGRNVSEVATLTEQTSYTITGLTLDTIYTITVTAANRCGDGPEFSTSISFSNDTTSTTSTISPTVTAPISKFKYTQLTT